MLSESLSRAKTWKIEATNPASSTIHSPSVIVTSPLWTTMISARLPTNVTWVQQIRCRVKQQLQQPGPSLETQSCRDLGSRPPYCLHEAQTVVANTQTYYLFFILWYLSPVVIIDSIWFTGPYHGILLQIVQRGILMPMILSQKDSFASRHRTLLKTSMGFHGILPCPWSK